MRHNAQDSLEELNAQLNDMMKVLDGWRYMTTVLESASSAISASRLGITLTGIESNNASVILLLISPDFFASDYCYGIEMERALQRHRANEARVIPILIRPVDWKGAPFAHLQALPTNAKPITIWSNRDEAFTDVKTLLTLCRGGKDV